MGVLNSLMYLWAVDSENSGLWIFEDTAQKFVGYLSINKF